MLTLMARCALLMPLLLATPALAEPDQPRVRLETSEGTIELALNARAAPETVANFLDYVAADFYEGTVFHRVIDGFMIQGGGMTADLSTRETRAPVALERSGLENRRGTIAMARTADPDSATSQFFINLADNPALDFQNLHQPGYTVFGEVVSGMSVVDAIAASPTGRQGPHADVPREPIVIEAVERFE